MNYISKNLLILPSPHRPTTIPTPASPPHLGLPGFDGATIPVAETADWLHAVSPPKSVHSPKAGGFQLPNQWLQNLSLNAI
jgi:hypothetical protein